PARLIRRTSGTKTLMSGNHIRSGARLRRSLIPATIRVGLGDHWRDPRYRGHRRGPSIRDLGRLRKAYGPGRWRKLKGVATVRLGSGEVRLTELHWYEAHGIGKKE